MAYTPFKMRGNPMKRNFGIGAAPMKMKKSAAKMMDESPAKLSKMKEESAMKMKKKSTATKMMKKAPAKMVKKGATSNARSKTPGPIVADTRVSRKNKTSKSIGPAESDAMIDKRANKVLAARKKAQKDNPKEFMPESKESKAAMKEYESAKSFLKMKKSPAKKPLVGKQKNLPEELKKKILASPSKMKKESMAKMKKESAMKMKKESMAKMKKETAMKMKKKSAMKMKKEAAMKMKKSAMKMKMKKKK